MNWWCQRLASANAHHQIHWSTCQRKINPSFEVKSSLCLLAVSIKTSISSLATLQADLPGPKSIPQCRATQWKVTQKRGRDGVREHLKCTEWSSLVMGKWCLCIHIYTFLGHSCRPWINNSPIMSIRNNTGMLVSLISNFTRYLAAGYNGTSATGIELGVQKGAHKAAP